MKTLILASGSPYRRMLLERLGIDFQCQAADADESRKPGEPAPVMAARLALEKARLIRRQNPESTVIGSDQVAEADAGILGKPDTATRAGQQLSMLSGQAVTFHTAVCVLADERCFQHVDRTVVHFRSLSSEEIDAYLEKEDPLNCAGSFKAEGLGIALFESIESSDPTALIGLPLIWLCEALRQTGIALP